MDSNAVIWIVIAVAAAIVVIALVAFLARARNNRRHAEAERLRQEIGQKNDTPKGARPSRPKPRRGPGLRRPRHKSKPRKPPGCRRRPPHFAGCGNHW